MDHVGPPYQIIPNINGPRLGWVEMLTRFQWIFFFAGGSSSFSLVKVYQEFGVGRLSCQKKELWQSIAM